MKKGFALKTFNDAGTEKEYAGGKVHDFTAGEYANFEAAGLVREPTSAETKADAPKAA
jgi:hypothetical protein